MSGIFDDNNRQAIPRWLDYKKACALGLLAASRTNRQALVVLSRDPIKEKEWEDNPTLVTAADLISESLVLESFDDNKSKAAARYILDNALLSSTLIRELAETFLHHEASAPSNNIIPCESKLRRETIAILKRTVRANPINPIAWSDLALCYAMQGLRDKSYRAMVAALSLGATNRFILRNAARCFLHFKDPDRAVHVLRRSGLCSSDPWIASAEIAISEGLKLHSHCIKHARSIVNDSNLSPFSRSEIAVTLSTIEASHGLRRKANVLIKQALQDPSENALAQVEWLATNKNTQPPPDTSIPASFEAQARHLHRNKEFSRSLEAAKKWALFQPFSSRPLVLATFLSSVCLNDDAHSIQIVNESCVKNIREPLLLNNIAFAYARLGNIVAATNALRSIQMQGLQDRDRLTIAATYGLVMFRVGNLEEGRSLYRMAMQGFDKLSEPRAAAIAAYYWACEEKRLDSSEAPAMIEKAKELITKAGVFELEDTANNL